MIRGKIYSGTIAASGSELIGFDNNETIDSVFISFPSGTPSYFIRVDSSAYSGTRDNANPDKANAANLIHEHQLNIHVNNIEINNSHGSLTLTYRVITKQHLT